MSEYYGFKNRNIQIEVEKEETAERGHIIFNSQDTTDIPRLERLLEEEEKIFVKFSFSNEDFNARAMIDYIKYYEKKDYLLAGRQYIAAKMFQVLEKKYPQLKEYEGSKNLEVFEQGDLELYHKKEKFMFDLKNVEEVLAKEGISIDRIHFIMRDIEVGRLSDALAILLKDNNPFKVSIYISGSSFSSYNPDSKEKELLSYVYSYTEYNKFDEGKPSLRKEELDQIAQKQKKKKKNEKVQTNIHRNN